ncbi:MAG: hypothetical protein MJZ74_07755 [Muribaculaceae bacterium]|nr:hypothetical protein [Muribaculaceae bacterium]
MWDLRNYKEKNSNPTSTNKTIVTGVNDIKVNGTKVTKIVENGQVIIVKGETRFNTMGQSIK